MRIIFFGTPNFAAQVLENLIHKKAEIIAVVSQPDKPGGRSKKLIPTPVKVVSTAYLPKVPFFQVEKASSFEFIRQIKDLKADLLVVVAYGQILKQELLDAAFLGAINVHASLLPKYRGAAPIQRSLMNGEKKTGVTIMQITREMDAGDILLQVAVEISEEMTFGRLENILCQAGKKALWQTIEAFKKKRVKKIAQDPERVTYAPKIRQDERQISWNHPSFEIHNLVRALSPQPGAWTRMEQDNKNKRLKILKTKTSHEPGKPGKLMIAGRKVIVGCSKGSVELLQVQPEGKKVLFAEDWIRGCRENIHF